MDAAKTKKPFAWQPFTFGGVAAFGDCSFGRLLLIQFLFAAMAAAVIVWLLSSCWYPVVRDVMRHLPGSGEIRSARLDWKGDSPVSLSQNKFLAVAVDLKHEGLARSPSHVQIEFGEKDVKIIALLGFVKWPYPAGWIIPCNREDALAWWGAWSPMILGMVALAVIAGLLLSWWVIALVLLVPVWIAALFEDRQLTWGGAYRVAGAAQLPGAFLVIVALFFYGIRAVNPIELIAAWGVHWLMLIVYAIGSPIRRPKIGEKVSNPFVPEKAKSADATPEQQTNPFSSGAPVAPTPPQELRDNALQKPETFSNKKDEHPTSGESDLSNPS